MKILITGSYGYVGGRLISYFSSLGHKVIALSRTKRNLSLENVSSYTNDEILEEKVLFNSSIDVVIHLAATNEIVCTTHPKLSNDININGTLKWLEWSSRNQIKKFIYFSTVHVYNKPLIGFFDENTPCFPSHPYSITHKAAEDYVNWYANDFNLNCSIVRLSNSFGFPAFNTADRWTLLVNDICKQVVNTKEIILNSNRFQSRDFISLSNVCTAINCLIKKNRIPNQNDSIVYNLSNGKSLTLMEMASKVKLIYEEYSNKRIEIIYDSNKDQNNQYLEISNKKLQNLGWKPDDENETYEILGLIKFIENNRIK